MRVSEIRMHRKMFGFKKSEVTDSWRKFHAKELYNVHSSSNKRMSKSDKVA
jgi:hypothetical protein